MITFEDFLMEDGYPIYLQMIRHIKRGIISGSVKDGDELPSRRVVSSLLGVNPNTVQKAYRLLEEEGLMESRPGAKSCMRIDEAKEAMIRRELMESDIKAIVATLKQMGLDLKTAQELIAEYYVSEEE